MKTQAAALWAATLLGFAAARPMAGSSCSSQTRAGSATIATYDHIPSNAGFHRGDTAKLMPGVYWDDDLDDVENLAPKSDCKLFYAEHNSKFTDAFQDKKNINCISQTPRKRAPLLWQITR